MGDIPLLSFVLLSWEIKFLLFLSLIIPEFFFTRHYVSSKDHWALLIEWPWISQAPPLWATPPLRAALPLTPLSIDGIHFSMGFLHRQSHKGMPRDPASYFCFPRHLLWCGLGKALMSIPLLHRRSCRREEAASSTCGCVCVWERARIHSGSREQCCI